MEDKDSHESPDVQNASHKTNTKRYSEILRDFDNLELSLIYSTTEELLPELESQSPPESISTESAELTEQDSVSQQQCEDRCPPEVCSEAGEVDSNSPAQDADLALCRCEDGVERALQYAKMWCRYAKDLLAWMEKRIGLEQEFAKSIMKAAEGARACVAQQDMMPLQYIYTMALEQDVKNSVASRQTSDLLQQRCYQALAAKRNEIEKWRREFKEQWARQQRRMNDAVTALKKARQQYAQRCEDLEKAKAVTAKAVDDTAGYKTLDKRRKSRDEAQSKVTESETLYRQCVSDARIHQDELVKVKERIISHTRKLICQGDTVLKEATVNMFYYQRQQTEPIPLGYHNLEMTCRPLEPGEPYMLYILSRHGREQPLQSFTFQEYIPQGKGQEKTKRKTSNPLSSLHDSFPPSDDNQGQRSSDGRRTGYSDSESMGGSMESLSSPAYFNRKLPKVPSTGTMSSDDLDDRDMATVLESDFLDSSADSNGLQGKWRIPSRAALTHKLRKMKSKMVKCKQCDNYIVVNGIDCEECGLALHRKCLEVCQVECEYRKGEVFGVDLSLLPRHSPDEVPFVVQRCTAEIEGRALTVQGVYRVSGARPRIQKLCQAFETQRDQVDLSDLSPHDISSVLKHFFKELPEPLLTFDLYPDFINIGKTIQHLSEREPTAETGRIRKDIIHNLRKLLKKLPQYCYSTLRHMMSHLTRVAENYEENKMSPGNLGIVFGPTLLRPLLSVDMSMAALLESSYQALLVEFLITHHDQVFGPQERAATPPPPPPPTAPLPETPPRAPCPLDEGTAAVQEPEASCRERPRSLENRTIERESSEGYISDKSSSNEALDQLGPEASERAVLAVDGLTGDPLDDAAGLPDSAAGFHLQYNFTRQPVKYHRHPTPGTRLRNVAPKTGQLCSKARNAGKTSGGRPRSADSSRSSSPDPDAPRLEVPSEPACQPRKTASVGAEVPVSPSEVVRYMLGMDATFSPPASAAPTPLASTQGAFPEARSASLNVNQSNNRQTNGPGRGFCLPPKRLPGEQPLSAPAQKILSGLKLRRSHSGKDEQLFV